MKGIILAGGTGSRLYPVTIAVSKHLLPVYDKPLIYYPLSTLLKLGIRDIALISTREMLPMYKRLLGNGLRLGITISYLTQDSPRGIAEAFLLAEQFIGGDDICLILGDNVFYNLDYTAIAEQFTGLHGAMIMSLPVSEPSQYGVVQYDGDKVVSIEEKPEHPKSNQIVPGIYFYDASVTRTCRQLQPSPRGELEITDLNNRYLTRGELQVIRLPESVVWFDTGSPEKLLKASRFVSMTQRKLGKKIACIEEICHSLGYMSEEMKALTIKLFGNSEYGVYLNGHYGSAL